MFGKRKKENKPKGNKKKGRKKKIIAGVVTLAVIGTAGSVVYSKTQKKAGDHSEKKEARSAEVTLGNISNTIVGTGNLELDEAKAIYIPAGLTVEEVCVDSGDHVSAGTVLAVVSASSVLDAVDDVQKELEELDEKISTCQEDDEENCIESSVSGRVKAIYVSNDSEVTDVMLENGALMELSLDGLMAVDLTEVSQVDKNDTVYVTLSDGTTVSGTVEEINENGDCTITVTDNGTLLGDEVSVSDTDGNALGTGKLYIHQPLEITGTQGTVSSVSVSLNETVDAGDELMVLDGTGSDAEYAKLLATREARTVTLNKLLQLVKNPEITAEEDGTIQDVNISADSTETSQTTETKTESGSSSGNGYSQMSYTHTETAKTTSAGIKASGVISLDTGFTDLSCTKVISDPAAVSYAQMSYESAVSDGDSVVIDENDDSSDNDKEDSSDNTTNSGSTDADNNNTTDNTAGNNQPENGSTTNTTGGASDQTDDTFSDGSQSSTDGTTATGIQNTDNNVNSGNSSDTNTNTTGQTNNQNQTGNTANAANTGTENSAQTGDTTETTDKETETDASQYSTDIEAFSISGDENMCLSVSVDELDINSVKKGQTAVVTFDAIEDKEFEGEVTKIGSTASVSGGVAKYTVEITIPKDDEMKQGMNASATITIEERNQVLTLPMNALQEQGDRTFVYTKQESDGTLSGEVEIQTGLTDGSTVEITDGLEEGDTVYYMRSESSQTNSSSNGMPDMSGGGPSGDMPDMSGFGGNSDGNSGGGPGGNSGGAPGGGQGGPGM